MARAVATSILNNGRKAVEDLNLLKVLQLEIKHEQSSDRLQGHQTGLLRDFALDWDSPQSQDVFLKRKCESGEEIAVSAVLGRITAESEGENLFPREVLMKVCIKKPELSSVLQFDCGVYNKGDIASEFEIHNAYYLQSTSSRRSSLYKGPLFSSLDPHLQDALKEYLIAKGIGAGLINFLLVHLHKKEQVQYVKWLQKLEASVSKCE